jgi:uncharacterized protein (UPF0548 family)
VSTEWRRDALSQPLPDGSFDVARRLVEDYRMADPAIVRATWDHDAPLLGREMLLQLRFRHLLWVHARVRVTRVWDEEREGARVFGFEYETLPGHLEIGRMDYEVWGWPDGATEFRLHARSKASGQGPWWARIGFLLLGRREQVRFYLRCCARMARLTARELGLPEMQPPPAVRLATPATP